MIKGGKDSGTRDFLKLKCQTTDRTILPDVNINNPREQDLSINKPI